MLDISVVEYVKDVDNGVGSVLSWVIGDEYYEFLLWYDDKRNYRIIGSDKLLNKLEIDNLQESIFGDFLIMYSDKLIDKSIIEK